MEHMAVVAVVVVAWSAAAVLLLRAVAPWVRRIPDPPPADGVDRADVGDGGQ